MSNNFCQNLSSPQTPQEAPVPQIQPNPCQYQHQTQFQQPSYSGFMTAQHPVASQPNSRAGCGQQPTHQQPQFRQQGQELSYSSCAPTQLPVSQPNSGVTAEVGQQQHQHVTRKTQQPSYESLAKAFKEATRRNQELHSQVKTLLQNQNYMQIELGTTQARNHNLQGEVGALRIHSVSKAIHDAVLEQNQIIAGNNIMLSQQNEDLQRKVDHEKAERIKILGVNHELARTILDLNNKLKNEAEKITAIQTNCDKLTQENQKLAADLEAEIQKLHAQEKKVKTLEKTLSSSEKLCKSKVKELNTANDSILNLNFALESSRDKVSSLMEKCEGLEKKFNNSGRKTLQAKQEELEQLINHEKERARLANIALHDKENEVETLEKQLKEEQALSKRKSQIIASVKTIKMTEKGDSARMLKRLRDQVGILKLEKQCLEKQLDSRREDIRKLHSQLMSLEKTASENEVLTKRVTVLEDMIGNQLEEDEINRQRIDSPAANLHLLGSVSMQEKIMNLEKEVKEKDKRLQVLSYQKQEREADNVELTKQLNELKFSR